MMLPILLFIVLVPFVCIAPLVLLPRKYAYHIALAASAISFLLTAAAIFISYSGGIASLGFSAAYISEFSLDFGLSATPYTIALLAMTSVVFLAAAIVGKYFIGTRERLYNVIFLLAEGS